MSCRNRKQRESADSDRDEKLALKERIAILETEIWRLKESEQHSTRLKREEYQISATRILALVRETHMLWS